MKQIIIDAKELEQIVTYLESLPYKTSAPLMVFFQTKIQQASENTIKEAVVADEVTE